MLLLGAGNAITCACNSLTLLPLTTTTLPDFQKRVSLNLQQHAMRDGWGGERGGVGKELDRGLRILLPSPPMFTTLPFFSSFAEFVVPPSPGVLCVLLHP